MQKPPCIKLSNSKQILLCSYFQKSVMFLNNIYMTDELNSSLNGISEHAFLKKICKICNDLRFQQANLTSC